MKNRGYQYNFSDQAENRNSLFETDIRVKKAKTMVKVISNYVNKDIKQLSVLNVGGSAGIIDEYLSKFFKQVKSMDIDEKAIAYAKKNFIEANLSFEVGDAMNMDYNSESFNVVICSQVYEHVQDAKKMMKEIYRVLKSNGIVYFAAGNRLVFNEPHYNLPFLSVVPRSMAHIYLRMSGKGSYYYEKHFTYWGLKNLVNMFKITDYSRKVIAEPYRYATEYMIQSNSYKQKMALIVAKYFRWILPGYIWILEKKQIQS